MVIESLRRVLTRLRNAEKGILNRSIKGCQTENYVGNKEGEESWKFDELLHIF